MLVSAASVLVVIVLLEAMELAIEYEPATVRIDYLSDLNIYCLSFESDDDTYHQPSPIHCRAIHSSSLYLPGRSTDGIGAKFFLKH